MSPEQQSAQPGEVPSTPDKGSVRQFPHWVAWIARSSVLIRWSLCVVLTMLVAAIDHVTGSELSFSIFYLVPVSLAATLISRRAGWVVALLSASIWGYLDVTGGSAYSASWIPYWNTAVRFGFFLMTVELLSRLLEAHDRERANARTDSLTGIANSRIFTEHTLMTIAASRRDGRPFTMVYIDLDRFKQINDAFGHSEGDRLLQVVSELIAEGVRETDIVARLGGDEFGILMPDTDSAHARAALDRIAASIAADVGSRWAVGATFGAVTFIEPPDDFEAALHEADTLMYRGKDSGRGSILQETWPKHSAQ